MKKIHFILILLFLSHTIFSQVGIGTENPQGILHIDSAEDNATSGEPTAVQQSNDVIVNSAGNIGIGALPSTNKLFVSATANPLKLEGLQVTSAKSGTLVTEASGEVKLQNQNNISTVKANGSFTMTNNNEYLQITAIPTETFDNLSELEASTFTPKEAGLYLVSLSIHYPQYNDNADGGGDGYFASARIKHLSSGNAIIQTNASNGKIPLKETGGESLRISVSITRLFKLDSNEKIIFEAFVFGHSDATLNCSYAINISRID